MKDLDFSYEAYKEHLEKERRAALIYGLSTMRKVLFEYKKDYEHTLFTIPDTQEDWEDRNFELYGLSKAIEKLEIAIEEVEKIV